MISMRYSKFFDDPQKPKKCMAKTYICMVQAYIMNILSEILSSKIRSEIFHLLFGIADNELHMREIEKRPQESHCNSY